MSRTGDRRFRLPVAKNYSSGTFPAVFFGPSCPQQAVRLPNPSGVPADTLNAITDSIFRILLPDSEDCLYVLTFSPFVYCSTRPRCSFRTVNVVKPALSPAGSKLPVVVVSFSQPLMQDGTYVTRFPHLSVDIRRRLRARLHFCI